MLVITGATGNVGSKLTHKLLEAGQKVTVIGRDSEKLQPFVDKGAIAAVGSVDDTAFLTKTLDGATALFAMLPPDFAAPDIRAHQNKIAECIATAIEKSGVSHVVSLSSVGAHVSEGTGVVGGLHDFEQRLNKIESTNVKHLRAAFFMENTMMSIPIIKQMGLMGSPIKADLSVPVVATEDIAAVAADFMTSRNFTGHSHQDVLGPRDMSQNDMAEIIAAAIEKPDLKYMEFPADQTKQALVGFGMSDSYAQGIVDLYEGVNNGTVYGAAERNETTTTPTDFAKFATQFAAAYKQS